MREVLKNMNKKSILIAAIFIVIGFIFTFVPISTTICYIIAGAFFLYGILNVASYFSKKYSIGHELVLGICFILGGVFVCIYANKVVEILTFLFGATLIIFGVLRIQQGIDIIRLKEKGWIFELICAIALIVIGSIACFKPSWLVGFINIAIGVSFIVLGVTYFITSVRLEKAIRDSKNLGSIDISEFEINDD